METLTKEEYIIDIEDSLLNELFDELNKEFFNDELGKNDIIIRWEKQEEEIKYWGTCIGKRIIILKRFINNKDIKIYRNSLKKLLYHELLHYHLREKGVLHNKYFFEIFDKLKISYDNDLGIQSQSMRSFKLSLTDKEKEILDKAPPLDFNKINI